MHIFHKISQMILDLSLEQFKIKVKIYIIKKSLQFNLRLL